MAPSLWAGQLHCAPVFPVHLWDLTRQGAVLPLGPKALQTLWVLQAGLRGTAGVVPVHAQQGPSVMQSD